MKKTESHFSEQEDIQLLECVMDHGLKWCRISKLLRKSMVRCHKRFLQLMGAEVDHGQKVTWTALEDEILEQ